jgi:hypothetical protein
MSAGSNSSTSRAPRLRYGDLDVAAWFNPLDSVNYGGEPLSYARLTRARYDHYRDLTLR